MTSDLTLSDQGLLVPLCEFQERLGAVRILVLEVLAGLPKCFRGTLWSKDWIIAKASCPSDLSRYRSPDYSSEDLGILLKR